MHPRLSHNVVSESSELMTAQEPGLHADPAAAPPFNHKLDSTISHDTRFNSVFGRSIQLVLDSRIRILRQILFKKIYNLDCLKHLVRHDSLFMGIDMVSDAHFIDALYEVRWDEVIASVALLTCNLQD
jgi:hypothetical protein